MPARRGFGCRAPFVSFSFCFQPWDGDQALATTFIALINRLRCKAWGSRLQCLQKVRPAGHRSALPECPAAGRIWLRWADSSSAASLPLPGERQVQARHDHPFATACNDCPAQQSSTTMRAVEFVMRQELRQVVRTISAYTASSFSDMAESSQAPGGNDAVGARLPCCRSRRRERCVLSEPGRINGRRLGSVAKQCVEHGQALRASMLFGQVPESLRG